MSRTPNTATATTGSTQPTSHTDGERLTAQRDAAFHSNALRRSITDNDWGSAGAALEALASIDISKTIQPLVMLKNFQSILNDAQLTLPGPIKLKLYELLHAYSLVYYAEKTTLLEPQKAEWKANLTAVLTLSASAQNDKNDASYLHAITYYLECAKAVVDLAPDTHEIDWFANTANVLSIAASQFGLCKSQAATVAKDLFAFAKERLNCYKTELWYTVVCKLRVHHLKILEFARKSDLPKNFMLVLNPPKDILSRTQAITAADELSIAILQVQRVLTLEYSKQKDYAFKSAQIESLYGKQIESLYGKLPSYEEKLASKPDWHIIYACIEALEQMILMGNTNEEIDKLILNGRTDPLCKIVKLIGLTDLYDYHPGELFQKNRWCIRSKIAELAINIKKNHKNPAVISIANDILAKQMAAEKPNSKVRFILNQSPEDWKTYLGQLQSHFPAFKSKAEDAIAQLNKKIDKIIPSDNTLEEDTKKRLALEKEREYLKNELIHFQEMIEHASTVIARNKKIEAERIGRAVIDSEENSALQLLSSQQSIERQMIVVTSKILQMLDTKNTKNTDRDMKINTVIIGLRKYYSKKNTIPLFPEKSVSVDTLRAPLITEEHRPTNTEVTREDSNENTPRTTIDYENLFLNNVNLLPVSQKYLIVGHSGVGKSTFCQIVANQWSQGKLWPHFTGVFWINFRNLTKHRYPAGQWHLFNSEL